MKKIQEFKSIKIGKQVWMTENLNLNHFRNGDTIPIVKSDSIWEKSGDKGKPACCYFENNSEYGKTFGLLYNGIVVTDNRNIEPKGWHVPTDDDWQQLEIFLGLKPSVAEKIKYRGRGIGGKLKKFSRYWEGPNKGATNESGFSALPGGNRGYLGEFFNLGFNACFWSSTENGSEKLWVRNLENRKTKIYRRDLLKHFGLSIRLIKD